jgi:hypothetical protein
MAFVLLLLLALLLFGLGFAIKVLWWVAIALVVVSIIGMVRRTPGHQ